MRDARMAPPGAAWAGAARWVESELGLHFPPRLWPDLRRGMDAAARRLGLPGAEACAERAAAARLTGHEQQVLAECLTVGETYFFRDAGLFECLATQVLEPLVAARRHTSRQLRLWSAGCSSGEEAYTLAMLLAQMLPDWREWNISILATDVSSAALQKGRNASYGPWSMRGGFPARYLPFLHDGPDGRKHVDPALRRMVRFGRLNLASDPYPCAETGTSAMDLVLCRNVLIYFEPARVRAVLARLGAALAQDGWLLTGSAELPTCGVPGLRIVQCDGLFALRRDEGAASPAPPVPVPAPASPRRVTRMPPAPASAPAPARALPLAPAASTASTQHATTRAAEATRAAPSSATLVDQARRLADSGELAEAQRLCREAIARDKLDPEATYLLASILTEAGSSEEAAAALRRTLYLQPDHLLARFALGTLALGQGHGQAGRRHLARALAQLATVPAEEVLRGSGGLTARELQSAIRHMEAGIR